MERKMFKRKEHKQIKLSLLQEFRVTLESLEKFNQNQVAILDKIKVIEEKHEALLWDHNNLTNLVVAPYHGFDNVNGEIQIGMFEKNYIVVPNYRNKSLINKEGAVRMIEVDKNGDSTTKYTTLECLTKDEKAEYKKDGFLSKKILEKKEKKEEKKNGKVQE